MKMRNASYRSVSTMHCSDWLLPYSLFPSFSGNVPFLRHLAASLDCCIGHRSGAQKASVSPSIWRLLFYLQWEICCFWPFSWLLLQPWLLAAQILFYVFTVEWKPTMCLTADCMSCYPPLPQHFPP